MEYDQNIGSQQRAAPGSGGSGDSIWNLCWYVIKWIFFVFVIFMGMKYFYDMNKKKQAANKLDAQKNAEGKDEGDDSDQGDEKED